MRRMWVACVLAAYLTGCGNDVGTTTSPGDTGKPAPSKEESEGAPVDPWRVVMTFEVNFDHARKTGAISENDPGEEVLARVLQITRDRLRAMEVGEHGLAVRGGGRFQVGFAKLAAADRSGVAELITRQGTLEFLIEVLPDQVYARNRHPASALPGRRGLWPGSASEFDTFKDSEVALWKRAKAASQPYTPTRPGFRLVREAAKDGESPDHFHLLEVPRPNEVFDGRMVRNPVVSENPDTGVPVILYDIGSEWQSAFGAWTEANRGLPMALVVDGEYRSAPVIQARLSRTVQILLGSGSPETMAREARALAAVLQVGSLRLRPELVSIVER